MVGYSIVAQNFYSMVSAKRPLKFSPDSPDSFYQDLRRNVADYFKQQELSVYANRQMVVKTISFLLLFFFTYWFILFSSAPGYLKWLACLLHGASIAGIGFNIAHDAAHGAYSRSKWINRLLTCSMDLMGSNSYMWDIKHNKAHHIYTNIDSFDEDIRGSKLLRLSPHAPWYAVNRYQHTYAWFLYLLLYFFIVWFYNFQQFRAHSFGPFTGLRHPAREWLRLAGWKLFYLFYAVLVPLFVLKIPPLQFLAGYFTVCAAAGFLLGLIFYLAHCVENANVFPLPENDRIPRDWAAHQLYTTSNFAPGNRLLTWFCGGLNFQVEHHLFPGICSIHYKAISPIIRQTAEAHQLPYLQYHRFSDAVQAHYQMLKQLSQPKP